MRGYRGGQAKAGQGGGDALVGPQEAPDALQAVLGRGHHAWHPASPPGMAQGQPPPEHWEKALPLGENRQDGAAFRGQGTSYLLPRLPLCCLCWVTGLAPRAGQVSVPLGPTPQHPQGPAQCLRERRAEKQLQTWRGAGALVCASILVHPGV